MTRPPILSLAIAALAAAIASAPARAQQPAGQRIAVPFSDPGRPGTLKVELVSGSIEVEGYEGHEVLFEVQDSTAVENRVARPPRPGNAGADDDATSGLRRIPNTAFGFAVEEENNAMWVEAESWNRNLQVTIKVPAATSLKLGTVNEGKITVRGVEGELELSNVNGGITAEDVRGAVVAETVNGNVKVVLRALTTGKAMAFATLNGNVDATFPSGFQATVRLDAGNGSVYSDFDITLAPQEPLVTKDRQGSRFRVEIEKEMRGTINGGGPEMRFKTFNGDIFIRKGG